MQEEGNEDLKLTIRGFARLQIINKDGSIHGDSGWNKNAIQMSKGWINFLGYTLLNTTGSAVVAHMALLTFPNASSIVSTTFSVAQTNASSAVNNATRLSIATNSSGFINCTNGRTVVTQVGGIILRYTGQFNASYLLTAAPGQPMNVLGVYNTSVASSTYNPLAAIKFNSSTLDPDQIVRATYEFRLNQ